ncbi:hypothetical protein BCR33DRAFT_786347 [Rhizoclosmatium globosum]|uniref:Uncharacterized protein n=1 Tax=Rhizoclosmatium globosum TaxID=329046 RepID=A0A1Y2C6G3_9FUNG|nr:hypothetical protein BCR33DRAFT_786347 [Rhizoclosmatium globosum]|eukprot:ORY42632.1 hypothetical protein BCR33DRAFT_786347 [Rhizoclosmatium globosum]
MTTVSASSLTRDLVLLLARDHNQNANNVLVLLIVVVYVSFGPAFAYPWMVPYLHSFPDVAARAIEATARIRVTDQTRRFIQRCQDDHPDLTRHLTMAQFVHLAALIATIQLDFETELVRVCVVPGFPEPQHIRRRVRLYVSDSFDSLCRRHFNHTRNWMPLVVIERANALEWVPQNHLTDLVIHFAPVLQGDRIFFHF